MPFLIVSILVDMSNPTIPEGIRFAERPPPSMLPIESTKGMKGIPDERIVGWMTFAALGLLLTTAHAKDSALRSG